MADRLGLGFDAVLESVVTDRLCELRRKAHHFSDRMVNFLRARHHPSTRGCHRTVQSEAALGAIPKEPSCGVFCAGPNGYVAPLPLRTAGPPQQMRYRRSCSKPGVHVQLRPVCVPAYVKLTPSLHLRDRGKTKVPPQKESGAIGGKPRMSRQTRHDYETTLRCKRKARSAQLGRYVERGEA